MAGITAVIVAIKETRQRDRPIYPPSSKTSGFTNIDAGNVVTGINITKNQQSAMSIHHELSLSQRRKLVEALLACDCLRDPQSRNQVVADLPAEIRNKINRFLGSKQDVDSIVSTCLQFNSGIENLLEIVE